MTGNEGGENRAGGAISSTGVGADVEPATAPVASTPGTIPTRLEKENGPQRKEEDAKDLFSYWKETTNTSSPLAPQMAGAMKGAEFKPTRARCVVDEEASPAKHHGEKWSPAADIQKGGVAKFSKMFRTIEGPVDDANDAFTSKQGNAPKGRRDKLWTPSESQIAPKVGQHGEMWSPNDEIDHDRIGSIKNMWGKKVGRSSHVVATTPARSSEEDMIASENVALVEADDVSREAYVPDFSERTAVGTVEEKNVDVSHNAEVIDKRVVSTEVAFNNFNETIDNEPIVPGEATHDAVEEKVVENSLRAEDHVIISKGAVVRSGPNEDIDNEPDISKKTTCDAAGESIVEETGDEQTSPEEMEHDYLRGNVVAQCLFSGTELDVSLIPHETGIEEEPTKLVESTLDILENDVFQHSHVVEDGLNNSWTPKVDKPVDKNASASSNTDVSSIVDLTPKSSTPWWSLLGLCRPSPPFDERGVHVNKHDVTKSAWWMTKSQLEKLEMAHQIDSLLGELQNSKNAASQEKEQLNAEIQSLKTDLLETKQDREAKSSEVMSLQKERKTVWKSLVDTAMSRDQLLTEKDLMQKELSMIVELSCITTKSDQISAAEDPKQHKLDSAKKLKRAKDWSDQIRWNSEELFKLRNVLVEAITNRDKLLGEICELLAEKDLMQKDLSAVTTHRDQLLAEKKSMKKTLSDIATVKDEISSKYHSAQQEIEAKLSEVESLQKEHNHVRKSLINITVIRDQLLANNNSKQVEIDEILLVTEVKQQEIEALSAELKRAEVRNTALTLDHNGAKTAACQIQKQLNANIASLKKDQLESKQDIALKSSEIQGLRKELEIVQTSLGDATRSKDKIAAEKGSMQKEMDEASAARESMQKEIESLHDEVTEITATKTKEIEAIQKELGGLQKELGIVQVSLGDATRSKDKLVAEKASMQKEMDEASAAREFMQKEVEFLHDKVTEITATKTKEIEAIQKELEIVQTSLGDATRSKDKLAAEKRSMQKEMDEASAARESMQKEVESLHDKVTRITATNTKEIETIQKDLDAATSKSGEISESNTSLRQEIESLRSKMAQITVANVAEMSNMQKELVNVNSSLVVVKNARDMLSDENSSLQLRIDILQSRLSEMIAAKDGEVEKLHQELETVQKLHQIQIEMSDESIKKLSAQLNGEKAERESTHKDMTTRLDEITQQKESQQQEMTQKDIELNDAVNAASQIQEQLNAKMASLEKNLLESKQDSAFKSSEVQGLQKELEIVQKSLRDATTSKDKLAAEKGSMQKEMDEASAARESMQKEIKTLHDKVTEITATKTNDIETIQKELDAATSKSMLKKMDEVVAARESMQKKIESPQSNIQKDLNEIVATETGAASIPTFVSETDTASQPLPKEDSTEETDTDAANDPSIAKSTLVAATAGVSNLEE